MRNGLAGRKAPANDDRDSADPVVGCHMDRPALTSGSQPQSSMNPRTRLATSHSGGPGTRPPAAGIDSGLRTIRFRRSFRFTRRTGWVESCPHLSRPASVPSWQAAAWTPMCSRVAGSRYAIRVARRPNEWNLTAHPHSLRWESPSTASRHPRLQRSSHQRDRPRAQSFRHPIIRICGILPSRQTAPGSSRHPTRRATHVFAGPGRWQPLYLGQVRPGC